MSNLIIGNTSQLNNYFPKDYERISSRNIDYNFYKNKKFDSVYVLFAEQRTFLKEDESFFSKINVDYTLEVVNFFKQISNKVTIYSTSELWNDYEGEVEIKNPFRYNYSPYIKSKEILCSYINENKTKYENVNIIYPFNFNSPYRKQGFLFSKIFDSVIQKEQITIGDINFYRDITHPDIIVKNSILHNEDMLIGNGELICIKKFVEDIYEKFNLKYDDFIVSNTQNNLTNVRKNYFSKIKYSSYIELLTLTCYDIQNYKFS